MMLTWACFLYKNSEHFKLIFVWHFMQTKETYSLFMDLDKNLLDVCTIIVSLKLQQLQSWMQYFTINYVNCTTSLFMIMVCKIYILTLVEPVSTCLYHSIPFADDCTKCHNLVTSLISNRNDLTVNQYVETSGNTSETLTSAYCKGWQQKLHCS